MSHDDTPIGAKGEANYFDSDAQPDAAPFQGEKKLYCSPIVFSKITTLSELSTKGLVFEIESREAFWQESEEQIVKRYNKQRDTHDIAVHQPKSILVQRIEGNAHGDLPGSPLLTVKFPHSPHIIGSETVIADGNDLGKVLFTFRNGGDNASRVVFEQSIVLPSNNLLVNAQGNPSVLEDHKEWNASHCVIEKSHPIVQLCMLDDSYFGKLGLTTETRKIDGEDWQCQHIDHLKVNITDSIPQYSLSKVGFNEACKIIKSLPTAFPVENIQMHLPVEVGIAHEGGWKGYCESPLFVATDSTIPRFDEKALKQAGTITVSLKFYYYMT